MPEGNINAEVAEHLREHGAHDEHDGPTPSKRRIETIEILEADPARHRRRRHRAQRLSGGPLGRRERQGVRHVLRLRSESVEKHLESNQVVAYNADTLNAWLQADDGGDESSRSSSRSGSPRSTRRPSTPGSRWTR